MSYICDYTKFVNHIEMADEMTPDMCCDGCAKRCRISLQMTLNTNYSIGDKIQTVCIEPAMFAGDKKLGKRYLYQLIQKKSDDKIQLDFHYADKAYLYALALCRKTCVHSKLR